MILSAGACAGAPSGWTDVTSPAASNSIATPMPATAGPTSTATSPSVAPTPEPTPPAGLALTTSVEENGLRVSVTIERNPMPAGEPTWATSRVENLGRTPVSWSHDGCGTTTTLWGEMATSWRPGQSNDELGRQFHSMLEDYFAGVWLTFTPEPFVGMGTYGCADVGITDEVQPGGVIEQRLQWNGQVSPRFGPPPTGMAHFVATSGYFDRGGVRIGDTTDSSLTSHIDLWVSGGRDPRWLDPPEIVDRMLASSDMRAYFAQVDQGNRKLFDGNEPWLRFNVDVQLWEAGLIEYGPSKLHFALIDPRTGDILGIRDRAWVSDVDGYP